MSDLDPVVRPARDDEITRIAALFSRSRASLTFLPQLHGPEEDLVFWRDHVMTTQRVTIAELGAEIVGVMVDDGVFLHHLYIEPTRTGRGVGTILLKHAQARLKEIQLWCFQDNIAARRFYERRGFVAVEETDGAGNAEKCADVLYRWRR